MHDGDNVTLRLKKTKLKAPIHMEVVSPGEADALWKYIGRQVGTTEIDALSPDSTADLALALSSLLPLGLRPRIIEFRRKAPFGDVLLVRGLLPRDLTIPATVKSPLAAHTGVAGQAAMLLAGAMTALGEPFNYRGLYR